MSETSGTIVIARSSDLQKFNRDNIYLNKDKLTDLLLPKAQIDLKRKQSDGFQIESFLVTDDYIGFSIFGHEWETFAQKALESEQFEEFYAALFTEYGESQFYTKYKGESYSYRHDEESDEECQEGFNYDAYESRYENHKEKWHAITPQVIIDTFKPVTAFNPCTESFEDQELKQSYTLSEYSQLMQKQLPQMIAFLSEKEFSAYDFFSQYTNKDERGIKRLINKKPPELLQILLVCLKHMHNNEPSDLSDEDDGTLIYPVPQEECDKILAGMSETIEFNWDQNRNKFLIPI